MMTSLPPPASASCRLPRRWARFSDPYFSELLAGIGNAAAEQDYDLLVSTCAPDTTDEMRVYERFVQGRRVDGMLVVRTREHDPRIAYLLEQEFPFVSFGRSDLEADFPYMDVDGTAGLRQLTQHLIDLGHRRIAYISAPPNLMFASHRLAGYKEALAANDIPFDEGLVIGGALTERSGHAAGTQILAWDDPPSAIIACNDLMALGVISALQSKSLIVGHDVAVVGYDDIPLAEHAHPPLTTLRQPIYEIGRCICEMLISLLQEQPLEERHVILKPQLVVRESCGSTIR
jgi:LacI family transcriptional regulator